MGFSGYLSQAQYLADELLDHLPDEGDREAAGRLFDEVGYDALANIPPEELEPLFVFLGEEPAPQSRRFAKLGGRERLLFWLRARYLAFATADALSIARIAELRLGSDYRQFRRAISEAVHPHPRIPSRSDLLWRKIR